MTDWLTRVPCPECRNDSLLAAVYRVDGQLHFGTPARQSRARQLPVLAPVLGDRGKWSTSPFAVPIPDDLGPTIATVSCARLGHVANVDVLLAMRNARAGINETPSEPLHVESANCAHRHLRFVVDPAYLNPERPPPGT